MYQRNPSPIYRSQPLGGWELHLTEAHQRITMQPKIRLKILFTKSRPFKRKNKTLHRKAKHKKPIA